MIPPIIRAFTRLATLTLTLTLTLGAAEPESESDAGGGAEAARRVDPMDTTGLDYGVANILRNYYRKTFTDAAAWQQTESIRFHGALHLPQGAFRFTAFKKKPDLYRIALNLPSGGRLIMAYDGSDAWELNTTQPNAMPTTMPDAQARNFIRDATTGNHLLYPLTPGKTITFEGTPEVDGQRTYHLRVSLPDGQQVQYFLDMTTFTEVRQIAINNINGDEEITDYSDFSIIDGIRVPFTSTLTIDGQQVHQSRLDKVMFNLGVVPWMFSRPAAADIPQHREPGESQALIGSSPSKASPPRSTSSPSGNSSFGLPVVDPWATESVFDITPPAGVPEPSAKPSKINPDILKDEEHQILLKDLEDEK